MILTDLLVSNGVRSRTVAFFMAAAAMAGSSGSPLSGFLLDHHRLDEGLQWLFLIEAVPAVRWHRGAPHPPETGRRTPLARRTTGLADRAPGLGTRGARVKNTRCPLAGAAHPRVLMLSLLYS